MSLKSLLREATPPFLWSLGRQFLGRNGAQPQAGEAIEQGLPEFEWMSPAEDSSTIGYTKSSLVDAPVRHFPEILSRIGGPQPYGCKPGEVRGDTTAYWHQQAFPFAYAIGRCLPTDRTLKVLDWGGGLGLYWHLARTLFPDLPLDYHIHELPEFSRRGSEFTPDAHFHFKTSEWEGDRFDLVVASGSLQYAHDWRGVLKELARATSNLMYLARIPVLFEEAEPRNVLHRPRSYGYEADVSFRVLPRSGILGTVEREGLRLVREFVGAEEIVVHPDRTKIPFRGYLLQRCQSE
jgi:putative methyltransferase (TIGR04325 family)